MRTTRLMGGARRRRKGGDDGVTRITKGEDEETGRCGVQFLNHYNDQKTEIQYPFNCIVHEMAYVYMIREPKMKTGKENYIPKIWRVCLKA